jgi:cytochrome c2
MMKRGMLLGMVRAFAIAGAVSLGTATAKGDKAFRDEFIAKYVKPDSTDAREKAFAAACEKAKCNICHEGISKKNRNAYGKELAKLLKRERDKDDKPKIQAALDKVAAMKPDPKSPTFGELIKAGRLPGGEPKESKDQPAEATPSASP